MVRVMRYHRRHLLRLVRRVTFSTWKGPTLFVEERSRYSVSPGRVCEFKLESVQADNQNLRRFDNSQYSYGTVPGMNLFPASLNLAEEANEISTNEVKGSNF